MGFVCALGAYTQVPHSSHISALHAWVPHVHAAPHPTLSTPYIVCHIWLKCPKWLLHNGNLTAKATEREVLGTYVRSRNFRGFRIFYYTKMRLVLQIWQISCARFVTHHYYLFYLLDGGSRLRRTQCSSWLIHTVTVLLKALIFRVQQQEETIHVDRTKLAKSCYMQGIKEVEKTVKMIKIASYTYVCK